MAIVCLLWTYLIMKLIDGLVGTDISEEQSRKGLDVIEHGQVHM